MYVSIRYGMSWPSAGPSSSTTRFEHEVYNTSTGTRTMLIIDVRRPLNQVLDRLNRLCLRLKRRWSAQMIADADGDI
ncbi:hypothetical protein GCM10009609_37580 [Pseudonocardia aurantiaca]|uniref:Uncharacterized protein n=1 Tax=Pseudonocardia aurantiaca TaxID=75290 RepID=A0ABW4FNB3_9PSEU